MSIRHNIWYILLLGILTLFTACSEDNDEVEEYPDWQNKNESYWENLYNSTQQKISAGDASWRIIRKYSYSDDMNIKKDDNIIVHIVKQGEGTESPFITDSVKVHYQGKLLPSTSYPSGYIFDSSWTGTFNPATANPVKFLTGSLIDGWTTALINMHEGDRWEIYVPYKLGYGTSESSSSTIPPYSTLIFDVTLVDFWQ